ncbi:MAG: HNH endonuclease [Planctomycetes bacterium]|nr:HNH endonuclease [Planctomycetota bacterium]
MNRAQAAVAPTDSKWFSYFRPADTLRVVDEVNFWRPTATSGLNLLEPGEPFFFKHKSPINAIGGFGFFAAFARLSLREAWQTFGNNNGAQTWEAFATTIATYAKISIRDVGAHVIGCVVLRDAHFLPRPMWVPWWADEGWKPGLVSVKGYNLNESHGLKLRKIIEAAAATAPPDLADDHELFYTDERKVALQQTTIREGQGAFKVRLLDAYRGACCVTREHSRPVLDAAHIHPYSGPASNSPANGLLLRTDLHRLFDDGYLSIDSDYRVLVSSRLASEFDNGKTYYSLEGTAIELPRTPNLRPSPSALRWHREMRFK